MVNININKLLKKWLPKILKSIEIDYSIGSAVGITNAKRSGKETNMNPLNLTKKDQQVHIDSIETLIKDVNSDVAKKINLLVNDSITQKWDNKMLADKLKDLFNKDVPNHFTYKNRFETIAQNESFKIMTQSSDNTARRLGAKKKWLFNVMDKKTADDSKVSESKYGSEDKAIDINKPFTYSWKGQKRVFMLPPDRVNDRSQVLFLFE